MSATIKPMELVYADLLTPSQLMEDDLVEIEGVIVDVVSIEDDATSTIEPSMSTRSPSISWLGVSRSAYTNSIVFIVSVILVLLLW